MSAGKEGTSIIMETLIIEEDVSLNANVTLVTPSPSSSPTSGADESVKRDISFASNNTETKIETENILQEACKNLDSFLNNDLNISETDLYEARISELLDQHYEKINNQFQDLINENENLKIEATETKKEIWALWDYIYYLEMNLSQFQQYSRRDNIEISGIPDSVYDEHLESTVINILRRIGVKNLESYEIIACHRLKKLKRGLPANVIVRFVNRK